MTDTYNIIFAGVGGQGLMLITQILGQAAVDSGLTIMTGEQHGLSQRSGSIYVHFRIGNPISPLIPYGRADMMIAMEATESLRYIEYLKEDGVIVMSGRIIHPVGETIKVALDENTAYTTLDQITEKLRQVTKNLIVFDSIGLATEAGNPRAENSVLLGAACATKDFPVSTKATKQAVLSLVPKKTIDANSKAFNRGLETGRLALAEVK